MGVWGRDGGKGKEGNLQERIGLDWIGLKQVRLGLAFVLCCWFGLITGSGD
jgi:hypothetical protein